MTIPGTVEINAIGIGEAAGVGDCGTDHDGVQAAGGRDGAFRRRGAGDEKILGAVRHRGDLGDDPARRGECVVDHPARAGPAITRKAKAGGGEALGDVAGDIGAQEMQRHSLGARAAKRGQAMADLLEGRVEAIAEASDVHAEIFGGSVEIVVGHEAGGGEVTGEGAVEASLPIRRTELCPGDEFAQQVRPIALADEARKPEAAAEPAQSVREKEITAVEALAGDGEGIRRLEGDVDPVATFEATGKRIEGNVPALVGKRRFGCRFEAREIVGVIGNEILDLLARRRPRTPGAATAHEIKHLTGASGQLFAVADDGVDEAAAFVIAEVAVVLQDAGVGADGGDERQDLLAGLGEKRILAQALAKKIGALARLAISAIKGKYGARGGRAGRDDLARILRHQAAAGERGVVGDLAKLGDEARFLGAGECPAVEIDGGGDAVQKRATNGAFVVFDEVEIARRDADGDREAALRNAKLLSAFANPLSNRRESQGDILPVTVLQSYGPSRNDLTIYLCEISWLLPH